MSLSLSLCVSCPHPGLFKVFVCSESIGGGSKGRVYPPRSTDLLPQGQGGANTRVEQVCRYLGGGGPCCDSTCVRRPFSCHYVVFSVYSLYTLYILSVYLCHSSELMCTCNVFCYCLEMVPSKSSSKEDRKSSSTPEDSKPVSVGEQKKADKLKKRGKRQEAQKKLNKKLEDIKEHLSRVIPLPLSPLQLVQTGKFSSAGFTQSTAG